MNANLPITMEISIRMDRSRILHQPRKICPEGVIDSSAELMYLRLSWTVVDKKRSVEKARKLVNN